MTIAIQRLYDIVGHFARFSYTRVRAPAFAEWGASSQLGFGAKLVRPDLISVGSGVTVGDQVWLNARDDRRDASPTLIIGDNTYIGRLVQVNAWRAVRIGRGVLIADRVLYLTRTTILVIEIFRSKIKATLLWAQLLSMMGAGLE